MTLKRNGLRRPVQEVWQIQHNLRQHYDHGILNFIIWNCRMVFFEKIKKLWQILSAFQICTLSFPFWYQDGEVKGSLLTMFFVHWQIKQIDKNLEVNFLVSAVVKNCERVSYSYRKASFICCFDPNHKQNFFRLPICGNFCETYFVCAYFWSSLVWMCFCKWKICRKYFYFMRNDKEGFFLVVFSGIISRDRYITSFAGI